MTHTAARPAARPAAAPSARPSAPSGTRPDALPGTAHDASTGRLPAIAHRWPSLLGLALAVFTLLDVDDGRGLAFVVFLAALIYLGTALLGKPRSVWTLFVLSTAASVTLERLGIGAWPGLIGAALCLIVLGLAGGLLRRPLLSAAQVPFMVVFGGAALLGLTLSPVAGSLVVAAALIGHAVQDALVRRDRRVVATSMAEFCMVLDLVLGVSIVVLTLT
jgi:hypothetical protein